jgi:hypothetical protein
LVGKAYWNRRLDKSASRWKENNIMHLTEIKEAG